MSYDHLHDTERKRLDEVLGEGLAAATPDERARDAVRRVAGPSARVGARLVVDGYLRSPAALLLEAQRHPPKPIPAWRVALELASRSDREDVP